GRRHRCRKPRSARPDGGAGLRQRDGRSAAAFDERRHALRLLAAMRKIVPIVIGTWCLIACDSREAVRSAVSPPRELRVCADPNNLPFSNSNREGFENRLADLVASELGTSVKYTWWAQRRGFVRNTISSGACDVLMGVPTR